jgi:hypothetical protein
VTTLAAPVMPSPTLVALDTGLALLRLMRRQGEVEERQAAQLAIDDLLDRRLELMLRDE